MISVALVYFGELDGTVHIYRDGRVILSSLAGITTVSLPRLPDQAWRRTHFLGILARLGATEQELALTDQLIPEQEAILNQLGFPTAVQRVSDESVSRFQDWGQRHGLDYDQMDESDIKQVIKITLTQVRGS